METGAKVGNNGGVGAAIAAPVQANAVGGSKDMDTPPDSIALPRSPLNELPSVQQHLERAAQFVASSFMEDAAWRIDFYRSIESPIEVLFTIWWDAMVRAQRIESDLLWQPQREVITTSGRRYRLDFVIEPAPHMHARANAVGVPVLKIAVELDGHDFHEKTKEQVTYRNQRDRDLLADGWKVLHFSGSEMFRDPVTCITQIYGQASELGWPLERSVIDAEFKAAALNDGSAV